MNTQTNKPLTVEQAAINFSAINYPTNNELHRQVKNARKMAFEAGAEWQKGQDKNALTLANQLATAVHLRGEKIPQLLSGYTK